jgi:hypothetical protein
MLSENVGDSSQKQVIKEKQLSPLIYILMGAGGMLGIVGIVGLVAWWIVRMLR